MKRKIIFAGVLVTAAALAASIDGCSKSRPAYSGPISLSVIDAEGLKAVVKKYEGKAVLIDFWATWCPGCVEFFPHTVDLHERYADKGLVVLTVSLDDPASLKPVENFLRQRWALTENFVADSGASEESFTKFGIAEGIPLLRIYDRKGNVLGELTGPSPDEVEAAVQKALK